MERIAPSAALEAQIADLLSRCVADNEQLAEVGRLGTRLVLQRAVEAEVTAFLGRARYERTPTASGSRNGNRLKPIQTAEGEIRISATSVQYACVLPAPYYALQVRSGVVSRAVFSLSPDGTVGIDPAATSLLSLDRFHGLQRLRVTAPL